MVEKVGIDADVKKEDAVEKVKTSKWHTLFEENVNEKRESVTINGEELFRIIPAYKKFRLFLEIFDEREKGLHKIFNSLWNADEKDILELRIHSFGGIIKEGQLFYNLIKNKFNGRTTTVLDGSGFSLGALVFCMGDERIAMETSDLMFHTHAGYAFGKGQEMESVVEHNKKQCGNFFKTVIVKNNFLTSQEFDELIIGKDFWMDTPEMCKRGIATHVMVDGKKITAKEYIK